ncbi:DUF6049 family protein [Acidimicrobiia bacterium EGI L10123]|uniref:DUF6049 family protein n=1 Tax=Salinilacustrithrix flava TaxID=2957203 RepID=UPI003D7C2283|nr:DUF6049 family protein [Acidimicrobiia bacterium EGI L10123]
MIRRHRLLLAIAAVATALVAAASPTPAQTDPPPPPTIQLADRSPWIGPEGEATFLLDTSGDLTGATIQVEVFSALDSVEELEESADEDVGVRLALAPPRSVDLLAPGPDGTRIVGLRASADPTDDQTVQLVAPGVHPVVITLLGADGAVLDEIRTPLVRLGDETAGWEAPDLAVLLDVAATPTLQPAGTRAIEPGELRRLARVGDLLAAHPGLDLSVAAVPDTVDALGTLPDPAAATLLEQLTGRDLLAMPYLPLPVAALMDAGLGGMVAPLVERGDALLADRLGAEPDRDVWVGTTAAGRDGARLLDELGFEAVVVDAAEADDEDEPAPLAAAGPFPSPTTAPLLGIVTDQALSAELARPLDERADASHLALARLLLRPVDDGGGDDESPSVLVRPGELASVSVLDGLLGLLDDPEAPVRVGGLGLLDAVPDDDADPVVRREAPSPDLGDIARRVLTAAGPLDTFQTLTGLQSSRADDLRLQVATAVASTTPPDRRDAAMDAVEEVLGTAFGSIRLSGQTDLNLTSRRGTLPVTIENANPFPVDLVVRTRSDRLAFPDGGETPVTVEAEDVLRIDVTVEALATGSVPVFVELWTPDGTVRLDGRQLNVRSTAISGVGLVLSLGALAVLVVWWVRHWRRTRRERALGEATGSGTAPEPMG